MAIILTLLSGCEETAYLSTNESKLSKQPTISAELSPDNEYERAGWYGFLNIEKVTGDAQITERDMVNMLSAMIGAYDKSSLEKWSALTQTTSRDGIYRDYGAMMLLYSAEAMDCAAFTCGLDPLGVVSGDLFEQEIRGGYTLFEDYSVRWDDVCASISNEPVNGCSDLNYLNASQTFAVSRLSLTTHRPLLESENGNMRFAEPMTYEEAAVAVVRLYESCAGLALPCWKRMTPVQLLLHCWNKRNIAGNRF